MVRRWHGRPRANPHACRGPRAPTTPSECVCVCVCVRACVPAPAHSRRCAVSPLPASSRRQKRRGGHGAQGGLCPTRQSRSTARAAARPHRRRSAVSGAAPKIAFHHSSLSSRSKSPEPGAQPRRGSRGPRLSDLVRELILGDKKADPKIPVKFLKNSKRLRGNAFSST